MPRRKSPEPSIAEWRRLYAAAQAFREQAPWVRLTDTDLFAVEGQAGQVAYCSTMGAGGMEYGLIAYRGAPGLLAYSLVVDDALDDDEALLIQDCLSFILADRQHLDASDRAVHAALGLKFRGRGAWPLFRGYRPNLVPAHLPAGEADFLATCLEQACFVANAVAERSLVLDRPGKILVRRQSPDGSWETAAATPPPAMVEASFDEVRARRLRGECEQVPQQWEVRMLALSTIDGERDQPGFWGRLLLCVDEQSGYVFIGDVLEPGTSVQDAFFAVVERAGVYPEGLRLTSALLEQQLSPLSAALGVRVQRVSKLPSLEEASAVLQGGFG